MNNIVLNYDPTTGWITDASGFQVIMISAGQNLSSVEVKTSTEVVLSLVKQGVTAEEIIKLKNADLL